MKKLTPNKTLVKKLERINPSVKQLTYTGVDPNTLTNKPCVAIVGTRKPTPYGKHITEQLVIELVRAGVVIISGLAFGIDSIAHKETVKNNGEAVAILPSGLENIYPATHVQLAKDITQSGCLISEYEPSHRPFRIEYLERNRIIAGLSDLVIIPEAAEHSGSLNTAMHAQKFGVPVAVYPGNITQPMSAGTNSLLHHGATKLILEPNDALTLLEITPTQTSVHLYTSKEQRIIDAINEGNNESTSLGYVLNIATNELLDELTQMEINGLISQDPITSKWLIS